MNYFEFVFICIADVILTGLRGESIDGVHSVFSIHGCIGAAIWILFSLLLRFWYPKIKNTTNSIPGWMCMGIAFLLTSTYLLIVYIVLRNMNFFETL